MNKTIIIKNDLLKDEIKALYDYTNRNSCNLVVVECMLDELQRLIMELKPCEEVDASSKEIIECPFCESKDVTILYGTMLVNGVGSINNHYICNSCKKEFDLTRI